MVKLAQNLATLAFPAKTFQLDSGLTVIHQQLPATPVAVVDVWVKAGAIAEPLEWGGMAHFLEHMIFKGTKTLLPGVFDREIEYRGGATNAATSHDYAHFFLTTATEYLPDTLPYLAEILLHASIPDEEFILERDVVLEELRASQDDPDWLGFQALCESLYQHHPYGRPILGNEFQLLNHSPNQMRCFHQTHYQPENMTVVIVGGVPEDQALSLLDQSFGEFALRSECPPVTIEAEPPLIEIRRTQIYLPRLSQARLVMAWIGPGVDRIEDAFGLDLLSAVLSGGRSARLVRSLREERQLVLDIDCSFSLQRDSSLFTIAAWFDPSASNAVEEAICQHLAQLHQTPITEAELQRAQRLLCHDFIFSTETPGQLAGLYGYYQTIATAEYANLYPQGIARQTAKNLQRLATQYLSPERYAISLIFPCE